MKLNTKTKKILLLKKKYKNNNFVELIDNIKFIEFINSKTLKELKEFYRYTDKKDLRISIMMYNNLHKEGVNLKKWFTNTIAQMNGDQKLLCFKN